MQVGFPGARALPGFDRFAHRESHRGRGTQPANSVQGSLTTMHAQTHAGAELQVVTREGDVITLDWSRDVDVTYSRLRARADVNGDGRTDARVDARTFERTVESSFSLQVQGDLNEQERADLEELLRAVRGAMHELRDGEVGDAGSEIATMDGLDSFASLAAEFEASRSVDVVRVRASITNSPVPAKAPVENLPVAPAPTGEAGDTATPTPPRADTGPLGSPAADPGAETALARMEEATQRMRAWLAAGANPAEPPVVRAPIEEAVTAAATKAA